MTEVLIENKQKYLDENFPFAERPPLTEMRECLHCGNVITIGDYKVFRDDLGEEYISCPHAPECDGTVIDWMPLSGQR